MLAVLVPMLDTANMKAILDLFQGKAPLVGAPAETQPPAADASAAADPNATPTATAQPEGIAQATATTVPAPLDTTLASTTPASTTPAGPVPTDNDQGVVPDRNVTC